MVCVCVCVLPEQEGVEWHSDRIPLSADPDGLEGACVSQLAADQLVLKHTRLLNSDVRTLDERRPSELRRSREAQKVKKRRPTFILFGLMQRTKKGLHLKRKKNKADKVNNFCVISS